MLNYKTINFNKSATIFIEGQEPRYTFYIIKKGRVVVYSYFADNYTVEYKEGEIIGLFNAVLNEPYFSTVKALEDTEVIEMNINEIEKINTISLINKIYDYLLLNIERWLNRYYYFLHKENNPYYNRHTKSKNFDIAEMCKIYINNGFTDAAYKLYKEYIKINPNDENKKEELKNLYNNIKPIEEPEKLETDIYKYKKGYCLYTELQSKDYLYIIKYGKIGVYNIFDSKQITRRVLSTDDVLNGYSPISKSNKYLSTTAIVLEDSIIQLVKKEDVMNLVESDRTLRLYFVKMMSMRIYSTISRIRSFNANKVVSKFVIIIEALIKNELLFKNINKIKFPYNINDICSMIGVEYKKNIEHEILKIKSLDISDDGYLIVNDVESFYEEYEIYKQRNTHKIENN
ncbi:cyclic nucleotide-binding domain-containing protein [Brachyspira hyodysenteriae]|uniref:cyclic nucleotide-binding domain-containing protein n=1 Tax=Brachyspira hyodysenteriae TaxID=159 RepID=UPI0022CDB163|nr:cyclic nucleotide-binding domain-containing protein [Brachyspira hyodysenteriae]MCZ9839843.1 cyclic nucleotide-binding domain-containing protein [Brachyspira hyodysenteriae]MCZ9848245.1 cyclic nucleotide-binding domain-containing protein [Brachyspira hyodysenteriae]MCZ9851916.1 cyclic nucleotide-binding domain-containing protein [Brachyspira hyodysenteriae]MCZ9861541.1 cyclic nucleotide-binding domain-containing protein [Brachyspira hyodysenteriae]MCZ9868774.1 cyclic nucleotide-binding doma